MSTKAPVSPMGKAAAAPATSAAASTGFTPTATTAAKARMGRKLIPKDETPEQAFKRLTEPRVTKALRSLQLLKNLSRFKPSDAHREKVFGAIKAALTACELSWKSQEAKSGEGFKL